jgi:hypothetical protein
VYIFYQQFGNIGGIIAAFTFVASDAPRYIPGYSICISFAILSIIACGIYGAGCWAENRARDRAAGEATGLTEEEKTEMGDKSPDYRYLL